MYDLCDWENVTYVEAGSIVTYQVLALTGAHLPLTQLGIGPQSIVCLLSGPLFGGYESLPC